MASPFSTRTIRAWPHLPGLVPDTAINPCTSEETNEDKDRQVEKSKDSEPEYSPGIKSMCNAIDIKNDTYFFPCGYPWLSQQTA